MLPSSVCALWEAMQGPGDQPRLLGGLQPAAVRLVGFCVGLFSRSALSLDIHFWENSPPPPFTDEPTEAYGDGNPHRYFETGMVEAEMKSDLRKPAL